MGEALPVGFDQSVGLAELGQLLDQPQSTISNIIDPGDLADLAFRELTPSEVGETQAHIAAILNDETVSKAGSGALPRWEMGWGEVLDRVRREGVSTETLTPQYFRHDIFRFQGRYIRARDPGFEQQLYAVLKKIIFETYLASAPRIVELGCGTGANLFALAQMFPDKQLAGCDWATASQEIIGEINHRAGLDIESVNLNMLTMAGWADIQIDDNTAILTLHAMEQLGDGFKPLLEALIDARPALCVHLEPIVEFYDPDEKFDQIAVKYHHKRKYLSGFSRKLHELMNLGKVDIVKAHRCGFGSTFQEAYSLIVWRPL